MGGNVSMTRNLSPLMQRGYLIKKTIGQDEYRLIHHGVRVSTHTTRNQAIAAGLGECYPNAQLGVSSRDRLVVSLPMDVEHPVKPLVAKPGDIRRHDWCAFPTTAGDELLLPVLTAASGLIINLATGGRDDVLHIVWPVDPRATLWILRPVTER